MPTAGAGPSGDRPPSRLAGAGGEIGGVRKHVLVYGLLGGVLIAVLQAINYRYLVVERSGEVYGGLVAAIFASLGIWLGLRLTRPRPTVIVREVPVRVEVPVEVPVEVVIHTGAPFVLDTARLEAFAITPRELEILQLMATGLSNREIAERVFVSENTVKTHLSRVFDKLGARRRTQAVDIAKKFRLIP